MGKGSGQRWAILLTLAAATAAASFYPTADTSLLEPVHSNKRIAHNMSATPAVVNEVQAIDPTEDLDPFAPRGWKPPPPPAPAPIKSTPIVAAPIAPPAPVGPPPLPFKFMGAMNDDGAQVIYLSRGDQTVIARSGENLDSSYKVLNIDSQHIEFEYLPSGEKQTLTIPTSDN
ncbi:MAG TPA: hypothetical protein VK832_03975 [Burkholderiaceae bacterium]|jgi:hypothetical protein|nr:hypothetical protein [Burkholderiaceae bacterium]